MTEYQVVYTINGEGYTKELPWIDIRTFDLDEAREVLKMLKHANDSFSNLHEEWIQSREITDWVNIILPGDE